MSGIGRLLSARYHKVPQRNSARVARTLCRGRPSGVGIFCGVEGRTGCEPPATAITTAGIDGRQLRDLAGTPGSALRGGSSPIPWRHEASRTPLVSGHAMRVVRAVMIEGQAVFDAGAAEEVLRILRGGGLIVYPTDTLYGLGADPQNPEAI